MYEASRRLFSQVRIIMNDVGGKDKNFLYFIRKNKDNESHHLILWSVENLMIYENLGKRTSHHLVL